MFERYTEKARRVIFFARYEALQYGSQVISPEHILLGLMREDKTLAARFFPFRNSLSVETVRREVEERIVLRERIPQSAELHLSNETKRILALAAEESRKLKNRHIGPEHLLHATHEAPAGQRIVVGVEERAILRDAGGRGDDAVAERRAPPALVDLGLADDPPHPGILRQG